VVFCVVIVSNAYLVTWRVFCCFNNFHCLYVYHCFDLNVYVQILGGIFSFNCCSFIASTYTMGVENCEDEIYFSQ